MLQQKQARTTHPRLSCWSGHSPVMQKTNILDWVERWSSTWVSSSPEEWCKCGVLELISFSLFPKEHQKVLVPLKGEEHFLNLRNCHQLKEPFQRKWLLLGSGGGFPPRKFPCRQAWAWVDSWTLYIPPFVAPRALQGWVGREKSLNLKVNIFKQLHQVLVPNLQNPS